MIFTYSNGQIMQEGDSVSVAGEKAVVVELFQPNTDSSKAFNCENSGGFLLRFMSGDLQLWIDTNEDICLLNRRPN